MGPVVELDRDRRLFNDLDVDGCALKLLCIGFNGAAFSSNQTLSDAGMTPSRLGFGRTAERPLRFLGRVLRDRDCSRRFSEARVWQSASSGVSEYVFDVV